MKGGCSCPRQSDLELPARLHRTVGTSLQARRQIDSLSCFHSALQGVKQSTYNTGGSYRIADPTIGLIRREEDK